MGDTDYTAAMDDYAQEYSPPQGRPVQELTAPTADSPMPQWAVSVLGFTDYFSITAWVRKASKQFTGYDPITDLAQVFTGDWEVLAKVESGLRNLKAFYELYAENLEGFVGGLGWSGNAASAADEYFGRVAQALAQHSDGISELADAVEQLKNTIFFSIAALENILTSLVDLLIELSVEALGGAGGLVTGGTTTVAAVVALVATIAKAIGQWSAAIAAIGHMVTAVYGLTAAVSAFTTSIPDLEQLQLPGGGYDHPGVQA
ncbi:hypothetical protein LZ318_36850 [Saccharopolyspora indica]|uniref:hypothetical protein n=1 Tax=Saccharopolyspora indica TaxID=1229659 RepID=UPI0022EB59F1|nr:hypothetical protein [Saccharopolyspora indica]MDA3647727.1 hypothetical protein [Saccharopolyspora indica]